MNRESRSRSSNLIVVTRSARSIRRLRAAWVVHAPVEWALTPNQMCPAGAMLDRDQRINPSKQHGVYVQKAYGQDSLGLGGGELSPGWTPPARRGIEACIMQDLPRGGSRDAVTEPDQLALHAPVFPR